ncbi:MAG: hypothetical protein ACTHXO_11225, partial [Actinomycetaceae bacterium]
MTYFKTEPTMLTETLAKTWNLEKGGLAGIERNFVDYATRLEGLADDIRTRAADLGITGAAADAAARGFSSLETWARHRAEESRELEAVVTQAAGAGDEARGYFTDRSGAWYGDPDRERWDEMSDDEQRELINRYDRPAGETIETLDYRIQDAIDAIPTIEPSTGTPSKGQDPGGATRRSTPDGPGRHTPLPDPPGTVNPPGSNDPTVPPGSNDPQPPGVAPPPGVVDPPPFIRDPRFPDPPVVPEPPGDDVIRPPQPPVLPPPFQPPGPDLPPPPDIDAPMPTPVLPPPDLVGPTPPPAPGGPGVPTPPPGGGGGGGTLPPPMVGGP